MIMYRSLLTALLLSISIISFGQTNDSVSRKIVGKWILMRHTKTINGKTENTLNSFKNYYEFNKDSTFRLICIDTVLGTSVEKGKWNIVNKSKTIHLYNITLDPDNAMVRIMEQNLKLIRLSNTELTMEEYFSEAEGKEISYYTKQ